MFQPDDIEDFTHLADDYKEPLFVYPYCDPSKEIKAAYRRQKLARQRYDAARKQRVDMELGMAEKLGRLHNLLRESTEREEKVTKALREKTFRVFEAEMQESSGKNQFNSWIVKLKAFVKKYKNLPLSLAELNELENDPTHVMKEYEEESKVLAEWINDQCADHTAPHHLAYLTTMGVELPLSEEDQWHRSLNQFELYSKEYWDNPILVQRTNGDLVCSILEDCTSYSGRDPKVLQAWCQAQQDEYQNDILQVDDDHYTKLVNAGFTFDVIVDDDQWEEQIDLILAFKKKFRHVHIPDDYHPPDYHPPDESDDVPQLAKLINKVRPLIYRDALSPKRRAHLKRVDLYMDLGGRVYNHHVEHCMAGREERGESQRVKRKFEVLAIMAQSEVLGKRPVMKRGDMGNWEAKLEKLIAYKDTHGNIDIQNDVKLRGWVFSIVRKLSINSTSLNGEKMKLIYKHEGLREFLLQKEHVEMAAEEAKKSKKYGARAREKKGEVEEMKEEDDDNLEELAEDVLLGKTEDDEVNAFMESGLEVPAI
ncbi:hypothetical protein ACHAXR_003158 [Thalassiosira sp. AJA248-18]